MWSTKERHCSCRRHRRRREKSGLHCQVARELSHSCNYPMCSARISRYNSAFRRLNSSQMLQLHLRGRVHKLIVDKQMYIGSAGVCGLQCKVNQLHHLLHTHTSHQFNIQCTHLRLDTLPTPYHTELLTSAHHRMHTDTINNSV